MSGLGPLQFVCFCFWLPTVSGIMCGGPEPVIIEVIVEEHSDVMLPCFISTDITSQRFDWMKNFQKNVFLYDAGLHSNNGLPGQDEEFKGRVSHFEDELKSGNASILIRNTAVADTGLFTCDIPVSPEIFHVELFVGSKVKVIVKEGHDVVLNCFSSTDIQSKLFVWMKDDQKEVFKYNPGRHSNKDLPGQDEQFKGRVSHFKDKWKSGSASILIRSMTLADSGNYTCGLPYLQPSGQISHVELFVEPNIKVKVKEHSDFMLPCSISTNITSQRFVWIKDGQKEVFLYNAGLHSNNGLQGQEEEFKGRVLQFEDELKSGNASILIRSTMLADSGEYTCELPDLPTGSRRFHVEVVVEPEIIKMIVKEDSDVMLPCSISTNIESKFFDWRKDDQKEVFQYNAGLHYNNVIQGQDEQFKGRVSHFKDELESGNASILIRNTKVADSGDYICGFPRLPPSGQICHVQLVVVPVLKDRSGEHIPGTSSTASSTESSTGWIVSGVLGGVVLLAVVVWILYKKGRLRETETEFMRLN